MRRCRCPVEWDELDDDSLRPDRWTIGDAFERLASHGDPLRPHIGMQQSIPPL